MVVQANTGTRPALAKIPLFESRLLLVARGADVQAGEIRYSDWETSRRASELSLNLALNLDFSF